MRASSGCLLVALAACGDEPIRQERQDLGLPVQDAGQGLPLYFQAGMRFSYCATLTFRDGLNNESTARYGLEYLIDSVEDRGVDSSLMARASGERTFEQNWNPSAGADSWLARLGPGDTGDQVGATPVRFSLGEAPTAPPARKRIPHNSLFFLDLRQSAAIRSGWATAHEAQSPGSVDPSQHPLGLLALTLNGRDEEMAFYPTAVKLRDLSLGYDTNGVLVEAVERLGDSGQPNLPNGRFELRQGPCS